MSYREPTASLPLILSLRQCVVAIRPETGERIWEYRLPKPARRLFVVDRSLFVTRREDGDQTQVSCFDIDTGAFRGEISLAFDVSAGIVKNPFMYLAGEDGVACITTSGSILWQALVEEVPLLSSTKEEPKLVARDSLRRETWKVAVGYGTASSNAGLILGDIIAQPDIRD